MKITRVLCSDCPSGIDCDRVYDTDGDAIAVQGRITAHQRADTATVLIARHLLRDLDLDPAALADAGPDIAATGRLVTDPAAHGIRTPPSHEAVVLVHRAQLPAATA